MSSRILSGVVRSNNLLLANRSAMIRPVFYHAERNMSMKTFVSSFKSNLKRNIENEPEFGGSIKRLQETSESVKNSAISNTSFVKGRSSEIYEQLNRKLGEASKPIIESKPVQVLSQTVTSTGEVVSKITLNVAETTANIAEKTADKAEPLVTIVSNTTIAKDIASLASQQPKRAKFIADPTKRPKKKKSSIANALVIHQDTWWSRMKTAAEVKWNDWGDSHGIMSHFVERVDGYRESIRKLSTTNLAMEVSKVQKDDPYFCLESFQDWVQEELFPKFLKADKLDKFLKKHTGEAIKRMWQTSEVFPLKYSLNNINGVEIFPSNGSEPGFIFSIRSVVEDAKEGLSNLHVLLALKQNDKRIWALSEVQVVEKTPALF